jgi:excisionase family DNA binding protein
MSTQAEQPRLLTVKELASEWRQHPDTIYRKIATGEIPSMRLGGNRSAIRVDVAKLERQVQRG